MQWEEMIIIAIILMMGKKVMVGFTSIYTHRKSDTLPDHLVPPASSLAFKTYIASEDYTVRAFPVGHIGMYVSSKVQRNLPPTIVNWLKVRS